MNANEIINKLNDMKSELLARGWNKGKLETSDGKICLLGARNIVVYGDSLQKTNDEDGESPAFDKDEISNALVAVLMNDPEIRKEMIKESGDFYNTATVWRFNDDECTSFNDVMDLIDRAIVKQKENKSN